MPNPSPSPSPPPATSHGPGRPDEYDTAAEEAYGLGFAEGVTAGLKRGRVGPALQRLREVLKEKQPSS